MKLEYTGSYKRDSNLTKLLFLIVILTVIGGGIYLVRQNQINQNKFIVVDKNNDPMFATHRELTEQEIIAKMEDHVSDFYNLFFKYGYELEGPNNWEYRTSKALKLIDDTGIELYNKYISQGVYRKTVEEKWIVDATVRDIEWDFTKGIKGMVYAEQSINLGNGIIKRRNMNAVFSLNLDVGIEQDNPHGYKITNFRIVDNSIID